MVATTLDERLKVFHTFLAIHAPKAEPTEEPTAHLQFYEDGACLQPDRPLIAFSRDDIVEEFDPNGSQQVRWLLEQMRTYDCVHERIVGLVFDKTFLCSEVMRMPKGYNES